MGRIIIPARPGVIACRQALDLLTYAQANYPDHQARADGYGNRWTVTITSSIDSDYMLRRLYSGALTLATLKSATYE